MVVKSQYHCIYCDKPTDWDSEQSTVAICVTCWDAGKEPNPSDTSVLVATATNPQTAQLTQIMMQLGRDVLDGSVTPAKAEAFCHVIDRLIKLRALR